MEREREGDRERETDVCKHMGGIWIWGVVVWCVGGWAWAAAGRARAGYTDSWDMHNNGPLLAIRGDRQILCTHH